MNVPELASVGLLDGTTPDRYLQRLDEHTDTIIATLAAIAAETPGQPLVVMCFENVHKGETYYRTWFRQWMADRHGVPVDEISAAQPSLPT